jgi:HK97 family phage prohead protease
MDTVVASEPKYVFLGFKVKGFDDETKVIQFRGTTPTPDRSGDVVVPQGGRFDAYKANPVFLWAHDWKGLLPIGKCINIGIEVDKGVDYDIQFDSADPFAMDVYRKYKDGYLNAVSIGIIPKKWTKRFNAETEEFEGITFDEWEQLELSGVPIPANPEALQHAMQKFLDYMSLATDQGAQPDEVMDDLLHTPPEDPDVKTVDDVEVKSVLKYQNLDVAEKTLQWNASQAEHRIRVWAGGPDAKNINWKKYSQAFLWFDPSNSADIKGYKLIIADLIDGKPKAVYKAVTSVMAILNGARGGAQGVTDAERATIYRKHIVPYYQKFGDTAPSLRSMDELLVEAREESEEYAQLLASLLEDIDNQVIGEEDATDEELTAALEKIGLSEEQALEMLVHPPQEDSPADIAARVGKLVDERLEYLAGKIK